MSQLTFGMQAPQLKWVEDKRLVRKEQLQSFENWATQSPEVVLDYETDGLEVIDGCRPFMAGFFAPDKGAKIVDFRLLPEGRETVRRVLRNRTGVTIGHNVVNELKMAAGEHHDVFSNWGLGVIGGRTYCTQAAGFAIDERREIGQKSLIFQEFKRIPKFDAALKSWMMSNLGTTDCGHQYNPLELEIPYNAEDVEDCWDLYVRFKEQAHRHKLTKLIETDGQLCRAIAEMELHGLRLDMEAGEAFSKELAEMEAVKYRALRECVGRNIDYQSSTAIYGLLYGEFKLPMHQDVEKAGKIDDDVLEWMQRLDVEERVKRAVGLIGELREIHKIKNTYVDPWLYQHQRLGRIHGHLNHTVAETRRFSADRPNLQNVPTRTELGRRSRALILADENAVTVSKDYSQVEYRFFAEYSRNQMLVQGYRKDRAFDIHEAVAKIVEQVRKEAKHTNFGIVYGMGINKLARKLNCTVEKAKGIMETYYKRITGIKELREEVKEEVRRFGYVSDLFGGRRHMTVDEAYKALNTKCQMGCADLMRDAIVKLLPVLLGRGKFQLQIHDELLFALPGVIQDNRLIIEEITAVMEDYHFQVPMYTDTEYYDTNWSELKAVPI